MAEPNDGCDVPAPDRRGMGPGRGWYTGKAQDADPIQGQFGTCPVGSYSANGAGLWDMVGNLSEWTADCFEGDCGRRVLRGSSWDTFAADLRPDARFWNRAGLRFDCFGFRVARTFD